MLVLRQIIIKFCRHQVITFTLIPSKIIAPAEEKHQARQQLLNELFHDG